MQEDTAESCPWTLFVSPTSFALKVFIIVSHTFSYTYMINPLPSIPIPLSPPTPTPTTNR